MFTMPASVARFLLTCCVLALVLGFASACDSIGGYQPLPPTPTPITSKEATATALAAPTATAIAAAATQTAGPTATARVVATQTAQAIATAQTATAMSQTATAVVVAAATTTARRQPWNVAYGKPVTLVWGTSCWSDWAGENPPINLLNDGDQGTAACLTHYYDRVYYTSAYIPYDIRIDLGSFYTITTVQIVGLDTYGRMYGRPGTVPVDGIRFRDATGKDIEIASVVGSGRTASGASSDYLFTFKNPLYLDKIAIVIDTRTTADMNTTIADILINGTP